MTAPMLSAWPLALACVQLRAICTLNHDAHVLPGTVDAQLSAFLIRHGT